MPKFKVPHGGAEIEVEIDGVLSLAEVEERYVPRVKYTNDTAKLQRLADKVRTDDQLLADAEFKSKALTSWGIDPSGKGVMTTEQVESLTRGIRDRELRPVMEELTAAKSEVAGLRTTKNRSSIVAAARAAGVREEWLTPQAPGKPEPIIAVIESAVSYDWNPDVSDFAVKNPDNTFAYSATPQPTNPFKTTSEGVMDWAKSKLAAPFLADARPRIPGSSSVQQPSMPGGNRLVQNDPIVIGQNLEAIAKGDATVAMQ